MGVQNKISSLLSKDNDWSSQGIEVGDFYFISPQTPLNQQGNLISNDKREQALYCLKKIQLLLLSRNLQLSDVMRLTVYYTDSSQSEGIQQAIQEVFPDVKPAVAFLQVIQAQQCDLAIEALAIRTSAMQCESCQPHEPF